ncbi:MAG: rRNA pseudouridine synthase [Clostridiales bacterium]|nr:rRNA pseudouridine synthase [Clostridiales bacterium]
MEAWRLQKYLSRAGAASRRQGERWILEGRVRVNGQVVRELGVKVRPRVDRVEVDGRLLLLPSATRTAALHKPKGVISTARDPQGRPTVVDLVPSPVRLYPVGRLDRESEGLILLTNDGELAERLLRPRYGIPKTYRVTLDRPPREEDLRVMEEGVFLGGKRAYAVKIRRIGRRQVEMVLLQGMNRQIRRMWEARGYRVERLIRTAIGPIQLGDLPPGGFRWLSEEEMLRLKGEGRGGHSLF